MSSFQGCLASGQHQPTTHKYSPVDLSCLSSWKTIDLAYILTQGCTPSLLLRAVLKKESSKSASPKEAPLGEMPVICCLQHNYCNNLNKSGL